MFEISQEDIEFLRLVVRQEMPKNMTDIRTCQRLRDDHGLTEYKCIGGFAGWWTLTPKGRQFLKGHTDAR